MKDLAKASPDWSKFGRDDKLLRVVSSRSLGASHQVEQRVKEHRRAFPEGAFGDNGDVSATPLGVFTF